MKDLYAYNNAWIFRDWLEDFLESYFKPTSVAYIRTFCSWQGREVTKATAIAEDEMRPKEKPRPPSGGIR